MKLEHDAFTPACSLTNHTLGAQVAALEANREYLQHTLMVKQVHINVVGSPECFQAIEEMSASKPNEPTFKLTC